MLKESLWKIHRLQEQVDSILRQHDVDLTLFVSVDSSTDGTENWFDGLSKNDSRVVILPHGRRFGGATPPQFFLFDP
jgi:rhamnosyltransferase